MLKKILLVLVLLLVALVVIGSVASNTLTVERTIYIAAPPAQVHQHLADLRTWPEWTAWTKERDPSATWEFSGAESGVGAVWSWRGADDGLGVGRLELTSSDPQTGIAYDLEFDDGAMQAPGSVFLEAAGEQTKVVWFYQGDLGSKPMGGLLKLFLGGMIGGAIGGDFETGLQGLKARTEAGVAATPDPAQEG